MKRLILALVIFAATVSQAPAKEWALDINHSAVQFGVNHIFSTVFGTFSEFEGKIDFNPEDLARSSFDFTVQVKSVDTGNTKRDNHLRNKDFFDAGKYPEMRFTTSKITHVGGNQYSMTGTMTLKETSKQMEIPFVFHGTAPSPFDKKKQVVGFDTEFVIDRLAFGVGDGRFHKMGVVGREVRVRISVEALGAR